MAVCKWCFDEFCVNDACPLRADFCPVPDIPGVCRYEEREGEKIMKKLFISQPMRGKTDKEILTERRRAIVAAERHLGEKVEVIDSFFREFPVEARPLWFLGKSIELLSTADVAYFAKGWEDARGCRIENTCAVEYGIDVIEDYTD